MPVANNSLSTVELADAYFSAKLYSEDWDDLTTDEKQQALNDSTTLINLFKYKGFKTLDSQNHEFPRKNLILNDVTLDKDIVPEGILIALYEFSLGFAKGFDLEKSINGLFVTSRGFASVRTTYDLSRIPEHLRLGLPSALGWAHLSPFIDRDVSGIIKIHRVS